MKILVFSDIHGDSDCLQKMIQIFENKKFDFMIIPGDFINHGPRNGLPPHFDQKKCVEILIARTLSFNPNEGVYSRSDVDLVAK